MGTVGFVSPKDSANKHNKKVNMTLNCMFEEDNYKLQERSYFMVISYNKGLLQARTIKHKILEQ